MNTPPELTASVHPSSHTENNALVQTLAHWQAAGAGDMWVFGYASLIWRPEFDFLEQRAARVHGWHRALKMWSRVNRGTPECPGLVFALLRGGSCQGKAWRIDAAKVPHVLEQLWIREMPTSVYDPLWLRCTTPQGSIKALAFTLPRHSPSYTGQLSPAQYREIFQRAKGRYGSTLDYAQATYEGLLREGIHDQALARILALASDSEHNDDVRK